MSSSSILSPPASDAAVDPRLASCLMCGERRLVPMPEFHALPRVTSDCRTFPAGGQLAVCAGCGGVQKYPDSRWRKEIEAIYAAYAAYHQADGDEQVILDSRTGTVRRRSDVILERLLEARPTPASGRALDIGCGSGVTLRAMSNTLAHWRFFGQDLDQRNQPRLSTIPRFEKLFVCEPADIDGRFDLITLIHSLEHFPAPGELLKSLLAKLTSNGLLLVQVCDTVRNPYDLLIADHLTHFSADTLRLLAENSGFSVAAVETGWVAKELSMVAVNPQQRSRAQPAALARSAGNALSRVRSQLDWLAAMVRDAEKQAAGGTDFGIFGTSISATWLAGFLGDRVRFFVDEDPSRQGKEIMGKPVLPPHRVPPRSRVYMALVPEIASRVSERLKTLPLQLIQPPAFDFS